MTIIPITRRLYILQDDVQEIFMRSSGPGGQNVNKVETAVQVRFNVRAADYLPEFVRNRLQALAGRRMTLDGVLIVSAQEHRSQERNRAEALAKLVDLIREAAKPPPPIRKPTKPTKSSQNRRLDSKAKHSATKKMRSVKDYG